jgi:CubicO group peptidase (beta-lactamase class C family)
MGFGSLTQSVSNQISLDWAGIVVERASGMNLNDYFHKNIFEPLGLKDITFLPSEEMKEKLAYMNQRSPEGVLSRRDHPMLNVLNATTEEEKKSLFFSGGGGLFAKPQDYTRKFGLVPLIPGG